MRLRTFIAVTASLAFVAAAAVDVRAEPKGDPEEAPERAPVAISVVGADAQRDAIVDAILGELATSMDPGSPRRIAVEVTKDDVAVAFSDEHGEVSRRLARPDDDHGMVEMIALMAGNLARDQAGALLAELTHDEAEAAGAPEPAPEPGPRVVEPIARKRVARRTARRRVEPAPLTHAEPDLAMEAEQELTPVQAAFVSPLGIYFDSDRRTFEVDFSVLFGRSGGLDGFGLHGLGSHLEGELHGLSIAGLWAYRGGSMNGMSAAGLFHAASSPEVRGFEVAGLANLDVFGDEPAHVHGVQLSGIVNAAGDADGMQLTGITNVARNGSGLQLSGVSNHAADFEGAQISGLVNTADRVRGLQLGLVNVARKVDGVQIGLVNVAEENDGTAIGLLNLAGNGNLQLATWAALTSVANIGLKMSVGPVFVMPSAGYDPFGGDAVNGQFAVGAHVEIDPVFIEIVGGYGYDHPVPEDETVEGGQHSGRLVAQVGAQITDYFGIFGGAGARIDITKTIEEDSAEIDPELVAGVLFF